MKFKSIFSTLLLSMAVTSGWANVKLPHIFSDNMVLQRNTEVDIWGWGSPGEDVKVVASWSPQDTLTTKADRQAEWKLKLKTPAGPGPYTLTVKGYNTITFENVMVGEVWVASGQSNMEWSAGAGMIGAEEAIASAKNANIRFFDVPRRSAEYPQNDVDATWVESTPETMKSFSVIAYFFGKKLNEELDVPIGLIGSNWGGTPAEIWIPGDAFKKSDSLSTGAEMLKKEQWGPSEPARAYNGMINPIVPYNIAGVIWYQGESNTSNASYYTNTFSTLIKSWREKWDQDFPFYYAQIAPFNYGDNFSGVEIRDAQRKALAVPNTGMVVLGDLGEDDDIHPKNKKPVGMRFANLALSKHYKTSEDLAESPLIDHAVANGSKIEVIFKNADGLHFGNKERANALFEVAGADKDFKFAKKVKLKNGELTLRSDIKEPKYVRYGWGNIAIPGLYNSADLPASSFMVEVGEE
ncbi:sialate O-acetylesterase [Leeuwenhoekiella sp. A16]|uniref:sialate O-acetylesterase n=1 Tax=unclassified Leeuwenhoekiella TaxID=2615029 RepID=UPI003A811032